MLTASLSKRPAQRAGGEGVGEGRGARGEPRRRGDVARRAGGRTKRGDDWNLALNRLDDLCRLRHRLQPRSGRVDVPDAQVDGPPPADAVEGVCVHRHALEERDERPALRLARVKLAPHLAVRLDRKDGRLRHDHLAHLPLCKDAEEGLRQIDTRELW